MFFNILIVFIGGGGGSLVRFLTNHLLKSSGYSVIYATLLVNIFGCFIIGMIIPMIKSHHTYLLLIVGFLGGLTTFSTFSIEAIELLGEKKFFAFFSYIFFSLILSLLACYFGIKIANYVR